MKGKALALALVTLAVCCRAEDAPDAARSQQLKHLGGVIRAYEILHENKPPAKLSDLYRDGLADKLSDFVCPGSGTILTSESEIDTKGDYTIEPLADAKDLLVREKTAGPGTNKLLGIFRDGTIKLVSSPIGADQGTTPAPSPTASLPSVTPPPVTASPSVSSPPATASPSVSPPQPVASPTIPPATPTATTRPSPSPQKTPSPVAIPSATESAPVPSPAKTLPPSIPFPVATPRSTPSPLPLPEVDPAAAQFLSKGIAQHSAGNIEGAIASYTSGIRLAPKMAVLYLNRANAYLYKPDFNAAIADANKALELKVDKADDAYVIRGAARAGLGDYDGAIADCNRALQINPKHALAYNNRANDKIRKRDYSGALADCNKSIALDPNSALPYYNRGYVYFNTGNPAGALADWKKAVRMQPAFGAELNPKIAQLEAQTKITTKPGPAPSSSPSDASGWTDLTNASKKIVGAWQGRHIVQYLADGSFYTDPQLVPNPPRGQWRIEGDRLIRIHPPSNTTTIDNILSLTEKELVIRNRQGETFRLTKISQ